MSVIPVEKGAAAEAAATKTTTNAVSQAEGSATTDKSAADAAKAAAAVSAAEGRRLYIGNLAYAASEEDIKAFFDGYLVEAVTIPKNPRTEKAVGYAFVDLSTPSESERAIQELAGKEILERKVSVQLAHRPDGTSEKKEGEGKRAGEPRRNRAGRRARKAEGAAAANGAPVESADGAVAAAAPTTTAAITEPADEHPAGEAAPKLQTPPKQPREKQSSSQKRSPSQKRERGPPADGVPSKTKIMVANLPYSLTEDALRDLFAAYKPTSTKIALRPIPRFMIKKLQARGEQRKGRGFGFVTLPSEELQLQAVIEMHGKEVEGREIAVKVAVDSPDKTDEALAAKAAAAAAAAEEKKAAAAAAAPADAPAA